MEERFPIPAGLSDCLQAEYGFTLRDIAPTERGFYGETWKIRTHAGAYFAKLDRWPCHKESYRASLPIVQYIADSGIAFVPRVIATRRGQLCCAFQGGILAVFAFAPGALLEEYAVEDLYGCLSQIYALRTDGLALEAEDFGCAIPQTCARLAQAPELPDAARAALEKRQSAIARYANRLARFSAICQKDRSDFHITHGDAGGNFLSDGKRFFLVDWDSVKLAPIERDAWVFMSNPAQLCAIQRTINQNGIAYSLRWERLCYYSYFYFFSYLEGYLSSILSAAQERRGAQIAADMAAYLADSWIYARLDAADASVTENSLAASFAQAEKTPCKSAGSTLQ